MHYLDFASTTPLNPEVRKTFEQLLQKYFVNSESIYPAGIEVNDLMNRSRELTARLLGVRSDEIIFTSGAAEANNTAIKGSALARKHIGKHIITTCVEHSSVLGSCRWLHDYLGYEITYLPVNKQGVISIEDLKKAMRKDTILVSIMAINNETGAIMPLSEIKKVVAQYPDCYLHVDAVQAIGKMKLDLTGIDMLSCSAHKIHGLKGSGFLMKRGQIELAPLVSGGSQEFGLRGGTANSAANTVLGKTLRIAMDELESNLEKVEKLHDWLYDRIASIDNVVMNSTRDSSPYIINFSHLGITSEVMMNALNQKGFEVSAQSTCDSRNRYSHVISSMFSDERRLRGTIRVSLDGSVTMDEIREFEKALKEIIDKYGKATV